MSFCSRALIPYAILSMIKWWEIGSNYFFLKPLLCYLVSCSLSTSTIHLICCPVIFSLLCPWFSCDPLLIFGLLLFERWSISFLLLAPISRPEYCSSSLCAPVRRAVSHWSCVLLTAMWSPFIITVHFAFFQQSSSKLFFSAHTTYCFFALPSSKLFFSVCDQHRSLSLFCC